MGCRLETTHVLCPKAIPLHVQFEIKHLGRENVGQSVGGCTWVAMLPRTRSGHSQFQDCGVMKKQRSSANV